MPKDVSYFRKRSFKISSIEAGETNSALIADSTLYVWGCGMHGRLGNGRTSNLLKPSKIEDLSHQKVEQVSLGSSHTLCILKSGKVLGWGSSTGGKLGLEAALDRNFLTPKELIALERERIVQVFAGPFHSLVLNDKGELFSFGNHKDGKLG